MSSDNINGKIQRAEQMKVDTMLVIGKRQIEKTEVSVRVHGRGNRGLKPRTEAVADILRVDQRMLRLIPISRGEPP